MGRARPAPCEASKTDPHQKPEGRTVMTIKSEGGTWPIPGLARR